MNLNLFCAVAIHLWVAGWLLAMARTARKARVPAPAPALDIARR